ncbi:MAG TPA: ATP-binding protein [Bryobacteraceae bacterium]|nr:ATP-binding protein [Bryobacteraceae bacterium]
MLKRHVAALALIVILASSYLTASAQPSQTQTAAKPQGTGQINLTLFGKTARFQLTVGTLGILVIISLVVLLGLALLFALIARRRLREAQAANRKLENEIRERKRAEEEVHQLNISLESRVAERTQDVQEANLQLAATNKELEAFAYSVSHDLRTPLRGIDGWSLALLEDYGEQLDERARQYLDRVRSETQRMGQLIDDMLQLSRVTRAEMQRNPVDLTTMANGIATQLREAHPDRQIQFSVAPGLTAHGDAGLLRIVVTNLLSNAVKFTGACPEATVEFGESRQNGESAFFVRDNGVGFDMAYAGTLFGAFQRLHKASEFPGTGIGLATVQRVVHRHGGQVWAQAQAGKGASFYFTIGSAK